MFSIQRKDCLVTDFILALALMLVSGLLIGAISAMLGIGGGMIMVPTLLLIFLLLDIPDEIRMHVASGTALCVMVATSFGSVVSHGRRCNIVWPITLRIVPGMTIGVIGGAILADQLDSRVLQIIFGIVMFIVSYLMIFGFKVTPRQRPMPGWPVCTSVGGAAGFKSGLLGVGGGALSVPWLTYEGLPQAKVSGTSSSFTPCAAVVGTIAFMIAGWTSVHVPGTVGYVFWPALPAAGGGAVIGAFFGARLANKVPGRQLRIMFGVLVFCVGVVMLVP